MRRLWWLFVAGGLPPAVQAVDMLKLAPAPFELPRRIGPMTTDGTAHTFNDPRLGVSYQYGGQGLSMTVYVYDAGVEDIPDGGDNNAVCQQFEEAKEGVMHADYQGTKLKAQQLVRLSPPDDAPLAREAWFEFEREGRPAISYVWITAAAKQFVKLRFSLSTELRDEVPDARRAVLAALGDAIKPYLKPVDSKAEKPGASMGLQFNAGSSDEMETQITYLMSLTMLTEASPERGPVCGGTFVPGFDTDLAVFREFATSTEAQPPGRFFKQLPGIEAAGFLEEFVWTDMHREEWGTAAPEGLALPEYNVWKKKNLKRFKRPSLGYITIDHPRPLSIEAADTP